MSFNVFIRQEEFVCSGKFYLVRFLHTFRDKGYEGHPHRLAVDMGRWYKVSGSTYLPRQDRQVSDSMIGDLRFEVSRDGKNWITAAKGSFGNIVNEPSRRIQYFKKSAKCGYFRLISLSGAEGKPYAGHCES